MRLYPRRRFVPHAHKEECPRCGWDYLNIELVLEERTGLRVCRSCYDPPTRDYILAAGTPLTVMRGTVTDTSAMAPGVLLETGDYLLLEDGTKVLLEG